DTRHPTPAYLHRLKPVAAIVVIGGLLLCAGAALSQTTDTRLRTLNRAAMRHYNDAYRAYMLWSRTGSPGLLDQAVQALEQARKADSKNAFLPAWMGFIQVKQQKYEAALQSLQEALRLDPNLPDVYVNEGYAYVGLQRYPEAQAAFEKAISANR